MASPPPFEAEDQTDEDFFDRLVNDDDDIDFSGPRPTLALEGDDFDDGLAFSNLNISEPVLAGVGFSGEDVDRSVEAEKGVEIGASLARLDANKEKKVGDGASLVPLDANKEKEVGDGANSAPLDANKEKEVGDGANSAPVDAEEDIVVKESSSADPTNLYESSEMRVAEEGALDVTVGKTGVASGTGVKEVQWSSFNSDLSVTGDTGFGSYSNLFNEFGDNSEDPFANLGNKDDSGAHVNTTTVVADNSAADVSSSSYLQNYDGQHYGLVSEQNAGVQDLNDSQYWENLYPGWRYDQNSGQWYQVEGYDANATSNVTLNSQDSFGANTYTASEEAISNKKSDTYYLQQTAQSAVGSVTEESPTPSVSNWNQVPQGNAEYPVHMVFDPQYPGWYYDTIVQEWRTLESYAPSTNQSASMDYNQKYKDRNIENIVSQREDPQNNVTTWGESVSNYSSQNSNVWEAHSVPQSETAISTETKQTGNLYGPTGHAGNSAEQQAGFEPAVPYTQGSQTVDVSSDISRFQSYISAQVYTEHHNQTSIEPSQQVQIRPAWFDTQKSSNYQQLHFQGGTPFSSAPIEERSSAGRPSIEPSQQVQFRPAHFDSQKSINYQQQHLQSATPFSSAPSEGRTSAGRPPHALVTFGFGGKLLVMKTTTLSHTSSVYGSQDSVGGAVNVLDLMEVVMEKTDGSSFGLGARGYFHALCQQSFPGPLVGGSVGNKELNKWIDDRIANCDYSDMDYKRREALRLLYSLLKIACQHYGKLRSPFGTDSLLKESDCPEAAVAKLFGSAKGKGLQSSEYNAVMHCLQNLPSEAQMQATALEVKHLLVSGRKKEALEFAQEGQLWGLALALASQLGDQFVGETVKQMAVKQLIAGSPLRTLCLLIAGQPADVFSTTTTSGNLSGYIHTPYQPAEIGVGMLDEWEENLAIITANRTKDDELVIIHLGDCLWKERGEVTAAHICYLVAEANFEPYSGSSRLCLVGADHWKFARTYSSPEAIQRTELYEYTKVLGNSQFILLPFQPYKLIYAYMLAEVGKVADSLKYCQAILKSIKTGRGPEVDVLKQLVASLEERLRTHQQGGYTTKLVGKLLTFIDSTANRVKGPPPPVPLPSHSSVQQFEFARQAGDSKTSGSQSTRSMPSLVPSASMEPISEWADQTSQSTVPNRSISEPEFGRSPTKVASSNEGSLSETQEKAAVSGGSSRFGRFGSQLFQKTVGLVLRSRSHHQAKLGETNKFYYDEKLKRWVEEGAVPPAEEAALPPPPTTSVFQNGMPDYSTSETPPKNESFTSGGLQNKSPISSNQSSGIPPMPPSSGIPSMPSSDHSSGIPPMPPSSNQFSARARIGVRSRYVDTFNKSGGSPANLFHSPYVPSAKPVAGSNPKFFIPTPLTPSVETAENTEASMHEISSTNENHSTSFNQDSSPPTFTPTSESVSSSSSSSSAAVNMQRFPSVDNIVHRRQELMTYGNNRRPASWSGSLSDAGNPSMTTAVLGTPSFNNAHPFPSTRFSSQGSNSTDELHELEI